MDFKESHYEAVLHMLHTSRPVSHQPFDLQGEEGGEEEEGPYKGTDDETQPKYPRLCLCPSVIVPGGLHRERERERHI